MSQNLPPLQLQNFATQVSDELAEVAYQERVSLLIERDAQQQMEE